MAQISKARRAVIIGGVRTPFIKAFDQFLSLDAIDLSVRAVNALIDRFALEKSCVDSIVWGGVILPSASPNVGREVVLDIGLPHHVDAMTVTRACASGLQAVTSAAAAIERGECEVVIAGGADSTSNGELKMPQKVVQALGPVFMGGKASIRDYLDAVGKLAPFTDILPRVPRIAERSTGQVMGEAAEEMARRNEIAREAQDAFAVASHTKASAAWEAGWYDNEVTPMEVDGTRVETDGLVRADTSIEKLARLRPVFADGGSVTAGNSSALTDGAAAVLLMSEDKAKALGYTALSTVRSWSYVGVDPSDQLLIGPALSMPRALRKAGLSLKEMDLIDIHEAFAAQVLSVLKMLKSTGFAKAHLNSSHAVGEVDPAQLNVMGGSLALGHPFAATGTRMVTSMSNALVRGDKEFALLGICAAGGLGASAVLQRIH